MDNYTPSLEAHLRIALATGLGPVLTHRLIELLGDPLDVVNASITTLRTIDGIGYKKADLIKRTLDEAEVEKEKKLISQHNVTLIPFDHPQYPTLLKHIPDPPPLLFVKGKILRRDGLALGVVGSRRCTRYGREQTDRLTSAAAQAGLTIVSGGARGIDAAAHRAALRVKGRTLAVLGCGLAQCYPPEHDDLYQQIADEGNAVVSEFPMSFPPIAENFPRRNRIISGLSVGVLVVEADKRSGALITARLAVEEHHREVLALPGPIDSNTSAGCHKIIKEGWATLVTNIDDILDALGEAGRTLKQVVIEDTAPPIHATPHTHAVSSDGLVAVETAQAVETLDVTANLSHDQKNLLNLIPSTSIDIDDLCRHADIPIGQIQSHLMRLQLIGYIQRLPGNQVQRKR